MLTFFASRRHFLTSVPIFLLAWLSHVSVHAQGYQQCTQAPPVTVTEYVNITIPPSAQVGSPIGPWINLPDMAWTCQLPGNALLGSPPWNMKVRRHVDEGDGVSAGNVINVPGEGTYRRFYVHQNGQQFGFIIRSSGTSVGSTNVTTQEMIAGMRGTNSSGGKVQVTVGTSVRMIKTSENPLTGTFAFPVSRYHAFRQQGSGPSESELSGEVDRSSRLNVTFSALTGTCNLVSLPSTVQLGEVYTHKIPNIGNAHTSVPFTMQFNNCPVGYSSIKYRFEAFPNPGDFDSNGILPAMPPSTATGVGVQVLQQNGTTPIAFSAGAYNYTLSQYTQNPGQTTYNVPLRARMIRRSTNATAGSVVAQMQIVVQYN